MKSEHVSNLLRQAADAIDAGTCVLTNAQANAIIDELSNRPMSKEQASIFLGMSRSNFDKQVREGRIPTGRKVQGFKELLWFSKDLRQVSSSNTRNTLR